MKHLVTDRPDWVGPWVCQRAGGFYIPGSSYAIGVEENGELIAGVLYDHYYVGASIQMHIAAEPGKRWITRENLKLAFGYPFDYLKVQKILGVVQEDNAAARNFDEHLGFTIETRIKSACAGGDLLVYSMTRPQCRFLEEIK